MTNEEAMDIDKDEQEDKNQDPFKENLPWVEKYRPTELEELISHQEILGTRKKRVACC